MINKIHNMDCVEGMRLLEDQSIDLTVTSPPYDNLRDYHGYSFDFEAVAKELYRVTKTGGVVVWVVGDATIKGSETGTSFRQALYFKEIGFNLHDTMIYQKQNPVPLTHRRYEQAFEYMFVFVKGKLKSFNPIMENCVSSGVYTHRRNTGRVDEAATRNRDEITITKDQKQKNNIWVYPVGTKTDSGNHPAVFPEQLAKDHIVSWSNAGDTVLDPFMGSGTTAKMAIETGRNFIGFEVSAEYCQIARERISDLQRQVAMDDLSKMEWLYD